MSSDIVRVLQYANCPDDDDGVAQHFLFSFIFSKHSFLLIGFRILLDNVGSIMQNRGTYCAFFSGMQNALSG